MATQEQSEYVQVYKSTNNTEPISETYTPPRTPTATTTSAHTLFAEIQNIHSALTELPNLEPGEEINALLTRLVHLCTAPYSTSFVAAFFAIPGISPLCEALRPICASAEGSLEKYWATRICHEADSAPVSPSKDSLLALFPYHQNYIDLSLLEASALAAFLPPHSPPSRIAFVGSGPLPLTSLCMLDRFPGATVHNIDRDEDALRVSRELCSKLGYTRISFSLEDVSSPEASDTVWESFEVVFLAALVGMDTAVKIEILASLAGKMRAGALVVARSARGVRGVLYPVSLPSTTGFEEGNANGMARFWSSRRS